MATLPTKLRRALVISSHVLGLMLLITAALITSALYHATLPQARTAVARTLETFFAGELKGQLLVGELERITPKVVVARNVRLIDPLGRTVAAVDRVELAPDLWSFKEGHGRIASAKVTNGEVTLFDSGDGLPTLFTIFEARVPSTTPSVGEPFQVLVQGIVLKNVTVRGELLGLQGLEATQLNATGMMRIGGDVQVRIDSATARVDKPFPFVGWVERITGRISTREDEGISIHARGRRDGQVVEANVRYAPAATKGSVAESLHIEIDGQGVTTQTVRDIGFEWMPELAVPFNGRFALHGPVEDFAIEAQLTSSAGAAYVQGRVSEIEGYDIAINGERIALSQAVEGAPDLNVTGTVRLSAKPTDLATTVHASIEPMQLGSMPIPAFVLAGSLEETHMRIDSLDATHPGAHFTGRGAVHFDGALDLHVTAEIQDIARDPTLGPYLPDAHGRLQARAHVATNDVRYGELDVSGRVELLNFRYSLLKAAQLSLVGTVRGNPERPALQVNVQGREIMVGEYTLGDAKLRVQGGPRAYKADGQIVREGQRNFLLAATARVENDTLILDADPIELVVGEGSWRGALRGLRFVGNRAIELELLRLANRAQRLEVQGKILENGDDQGSVLLQGFDLTAIAAVVGPDFPFTKGNADAQITLAGDLRAPILQLQGALRDGEVAEIRDVNAVYFVSYAKGAVDLDAEVDLGERGLLQMRGSGEIDLKYKDPLQALLAARYSLALASQGLALNLSPQLSKAGIDGRISGELRVEGTLDSPELHGSIELDPITLPKLPPLQAVIEIDHSGLDLRMRASIGDARGPLALAQAHAELPIREALRDPQRFRAALEQAPWELAVQSVERRLDRMPAIIADAAPYPIAFSINGTVQQRAGQLTGSASWTGAWQGAPPDTQCAVDVLPRARGTIELSNDSAQLELFALLGPRRIASVTVNIQSAMEQLVREGKLAPPEHFQARGRIDVPTIEKVPFLCEYGRGSLEGDIELDGGRNTEPLLVSSIEASFIPHTVQQGTRRKTRVRGCGGAPIKLALEATADAKRLSGKAVMSGCHGGTSNLTAELPIDWDAMYVWPTFSQTRPIELTIDLEGAQLKPLLDRIPGVRNSDVLARGQIDVTGTLQAPRARGQISAEQGRFYLVSMGQEITNLATRIELRESWAKITTLSARSGRGTLEVAGGLGFDGLVPKRAQIAIKTKNLPILKEGAEIAWVTGSAAVDATFVSGGLRAVAKSHALSIRLPDTENRVLQPLDTHPDVARSDEMVVAFEEPYLLELQFDGRSGVYVRRNDFDARLVTELAVQYADPEMRVGGYVEFRSGTFETLGRPFAIERGSLRFDGTASLNPDVILIATHRAEAAGSSPVTVSVTGTLTEPEVTFSSDACPGDNGAITYMISGQCVADDADLAQESENAEQAFAVGIAGSSVLTLLGTPPRVGGVTPRVGVESRGHGYDTRFKAGVASESLVPKFMRKLVRRMYVQGAISTRSSEDGELVEQESSEDAFARSLDFLIELYFPHNIVGSGKFAPGNWGLDVTWEP